MAAPEERTLVTVLFADLAESTELAARPDPEQLRALLSAFFEEMAQQIRGHRQRRAVAHLLGMEGETGQSDPIPTDPRARRPR